MRVLFVFAWILFSELFVLGTLPPSGQIEWGGATQPHTVLSPLPRPPVAPPGCHVKTSFSGRPWNLMASTEWGATGPDGLCTWGFQALGFYFAAALHLTERPGRRVVLGWRVKQGQITWARYTRGALSAFYPITPETR